MTTMMIMIIIIIEFLIDLLLFSCVLGVLSLAGGEADGHFRTDQDAPDVTNSDPNDWHMHQWPETNDFLKSRVQSFSNLTLMNGDPPHVFFVFTSDDPRIRLKAR